jgi:hypothetical protein
MKLIPISQYLYDQVMNELNKLEDHPTMLYPLYSPEQKYHILRYLINFLDSKQGEIAKEMD